MLRKKQTKKQTKGNSLQKLYKKSDSLKLNVDLKNAFARDKIESCIKFDEVFAKVLNRKAALKKKILRVNGSSYISETLWKAIMRTSYFEEKYFRKKTTD